MPSEFLLTFPVLDNCVDAVYGIHGDILDSRRVHIVRKCVCCPVLLVLVDLLYKLACILYRALGPNDLGAGGLSTIGANCSRK